MNVVRLLALCLFLAASSSFSDTPHDGYGSARLPDSSVYEGAFKNGLFDGQGTLTWPDNSAHYRGGFENGLFNGQGTYTWRDGSRYQGEFANGLMQGRGETRYTNGEVHRGEYRNGLRNGYGVLHDTLGIRYAGEFQDNWIHGHGVFFARNGDLYIGTFEHGVFTGEGVIQRQDGSRYIGQAKNGGFDGQGTLIMANGYRYSGHFQNGKLIGKGTATTNDGTEYVGDFKNWMYDGKGLLTYRNGNRYEGEFRAGLFNGEGTFFYKHPVDGKTSQHGHWEMGERIDDPEQVNADDSTQPLNIETLFYRQPELLARALQKVTKSRKGSTDLYFVGFGGSNEQDVFMKEIRYTQRLFEDKFGARRRALSLINSRETLADTPLASVANLQGALNAIARKMNPGEDILFLFLSSHGDKDRTLAVELDDLPMQTLTAEVLADSLKQAGIKWKVVVISACYSGGFIDSLKDDYSMIITAARADRTSFGCSNDAEFTYFGEAFFERALRDTGSFTDAFDKAKLIVSAREKKQHYTPSEPQIVYSPAILAKLNEWRKHLLTRIQ